MSTWRNRDFYQLMRWRNLKCSTLLEAAVRFLHPIAMTATASLFLACCAVGPDYRSPSAPAVASLTPEPIKAQMSGPDRQAYVQGLEIPQRWWELLRCRLSTPLRRAPSTATPISKRRRLRCGSPTPTPRLLAAPSSRKLAPALAPPRKNRRRARWRRAPALRHSLSRRASCLSHLCRMFSG